MKFITVLSTLIFTFCISAQCPTQSIELSTQAEVNAFPNDYNGCTFLSDGVDLKISGNDITDLSPLNQLTGLYGVLEIRDCANLTSLNGLDNISVVGNDALDGLILRDLPSLNDISALSSLDTIVGEFTIRTCAQLSNLQGFNNLVYVDGSVIIRDNNSLVSLQGFNQLDFIGETLEIVENGSLTDISALSSVDTITGGIEGGVFIEANSALSSLSGLGNADTHIGSNLDLLMNGDLYFCSVPSICKYLSNPPLGSIITITGNLTGCNSQAEIENVCPTVSIEDIHPSAEVFMIKNTLVNNVLEITTNHAQTVNIYSVSGVEEHYLLSKGKNVILVNHLSTGFYIVRSQRSQILKFVKIN